MLTITAKHQETAENKQDGKYICRERRVGSYARSFDVSGIQEEGISAAYENGVLTLILPKQARSSPRAGKSLFSKQKKNSGGRACGSARFFRKNFSVPLAYSEELVYPCLSNLLSRVLI